MRDLEGFQVQDAAPLQRTQCWKAESKHHPVGRVLSHSVA